MEHPNAPALTFGRFRLSPGEHALFDGERLIRLGSRALEILTALVIRAGELVTKEELIRLVWPDTSVEEGNLRVHIAALRKALGDGQDGMRYIGNVPGRGYRFVAAVERASIAAPPRARRSQVLLELPAPLVRMVGRTGLVDALSQQLLGRRFVTLVGPGGMGKTTLALSIAECVGASYEHGARFVDLASLADDALLPSALASALGLPAAAENRQDQIHAFLADKQMLILLDNCEHVASAVAALAEGLLRAARGVHLLLTSREPLRAQGEWVSRLPALDSPTPSGVLSAAEALTFSAIQLFVERASSADEEFRLTDSEAPVVADICRRLDGNPLAIELAASRVRVFGARELSARLDARFALTMKGNDSALPRHHTLLATLDWSYESLSEPERIVLRRVAVFNARFSWRSAVAVCVDATISDSEARDAASDLVAKSLLVADASGDQVRFRLLELTREYARQKLAESGEQTELARRHAEHYRDIFESAEQKLRTHAPELWLAAYRWHIDEVRAALEWAFGPRGDMSIGVALTVTSIPLWFQASLMDEYRIHLERALEKVKAELPPDPVRELKLSVALGHLLLHSIGPVPEVTRLVERALELSNGLPIPLRLHAVWAMWLTQIGHADYPAVLRLAERFGKLSAESPDPSSRLLYDRMMALPLHFLGKHRAARNHIGRVLSQPAALARFAYNPMTHVDQQVSMQTLLARIYWLEGFPEQAMTAASECVERALGTSHATSVCHALALGACPIALWSGATDVARRWTSLLMAQATRYSLGYWESWGNAVGLALELQDEQSRGAPPRSVPRAHVGGMQADMLGTLSEEFLDAEAIRRSDAGVVGWCAPEIARAQGTLLLRRGGPKNQTVAESLFVGALESARQQRALSWELRCATSLARLRIDQARATEARDLLASVCERFTEGFHTTDLVRATTILAELKA